MNKRITFLIIVGTLLCVLFSSFAVGSFADTQHLYDGADLLTAEQEATLEAELAQVSEKYDCFVAIVTVVDYNEDLKAAAISQTRSSWGNDVILFYIEIPENASEDERGYYIYPMPGGDGDEAVTTSAMEYIEDEVVPYLRNSNYYAACRSFVSRTKYVLEDYRTNGGSFKAPYPFIRNIVIALIVALIVGAIYVSSLKKQLKSVEKQTQAANYVKAGSMNVTVQKDLFLYTAVTKTPKPKNTSSSSSGGRTFGGGSTGGGHGGRF